jgi:hypothetical protein
MTTTEDAPWDEPVDGAELVYEICAVLRRHLSMPPGAVEVSALFVPVTYMMAAFGIAPRIYVWSLVGGCGKCTYLAIMGQLCSRPLMDSGASPATLYHAIDAGGRTLFLDESDNRSLKSGLMLSVLNSGHSRHAASIGRVVGGVLKEFSTFAPGIIATRGRTLVANLISRCIEWQMHPALPSEHLEEFRSDRPDAYLRELRRKAAKWAEDHLEAAKAYEPEVPPRSITAHATTSAPC